MFLNGSPAPAVILWKDKSGKYHVLDGVQRITAAIDADITRCCAYVVAHNTSPATQMYIRCCGNGRINGQHTPDKNFQLQSAVENLYFAHGFSVEEIALGVGTTPKKVLDEIAFQHTIENYRCIGYEGRYTRRNKKWFTVAVGRAAEDEDFFKAPKEIKHFLDTIEECKFKNGDANDHINDFFSIKRTSRRSRAEQFRDKYSEFKRKPEIRQRLGVKSDKSHIPEVLPAIRRACTTVQNAVNAKEEILDDGYAAEIAETFNNLHEGLRKITPNEVLYPRGKHSSIYDKG